ncbi:MAG: hypothetical protein L3J63_04190 [Geopsychrobacter sp.]|nr:hypothetical protein [Geopsychrobacter sp.]
MTICIDPKPQAVENTSHYLKKAIEAIDKELGDGFAKEHPELIAAFVQSAALDGIRAALSEVADEIGNVAQGAGT